jgi:hypothetical protein
MSTSGFEMDTREMDALERKIVRANDKFGGKPVEDILMTGARTIRKEARKRAPKGKSFSSTRDETRSLGLVREAVTTIHKAGDLKRAIMAKRIRTRSQRKEIREGNTKVLGKVFAGRGFKKDYHKAPHYHLVHDGTTERFHKSTGKSVGRMTAQPFFADAVEATRGPVLIQINRDLDALWGKTFEGEGVI